MQIDSIKYPVHSLGPGNRLVIWTIGCCRKCKNCISPRLQDSNPDMDIDVNVLFEHILEVLDGEKIDGITISGGDPFVQKKELIKLVDLLSTLSKDILIYTGYTYKELEKMMSSDELSFLRSKISVLIDGPYIDELNDNQSVLRGSTNQIMHFFNNEYIDKYKTYEIEGRKIEIFTEDNGIRIVGIQNKEKV